MDIWKDVDDKLNEMNARTYKEEIKAKKGMSLNISDDETAKIHMAEDGYGKAKSEGLDENGNDTVISTDKNETVLRKFIKGDLDIIDQITSLRKVFQDVTNRFKK